MEITFFLFLVWEGENRENVFEKREKENRNVLMVEHPNI